MSETTKPTIAVAGASGFIGQALAEVMGETSHLIGISRSTREPDEKYDEYRQADLFSLMDSEAALANVDYAIYLVHSMLPSARLVQGNFADLDLLCADNFARAAKKNGVKQIVYLGGLLPTDGMGSAHLQSREEVERALGSTQIPVTTLRAGLVVGPTGSSFQILLRLVRRLPIMVCPSWTNTQMQPAAINDVTKAIQTVCGNPAHYNKTYDLGCTEMVTYRSLIAQTAETLGLERTLISVPMLSPKLSRLWISLTTGAPKALVAPLVSSLRVKMTVRPTHRLPNIEPTSLHKMLQDAITQATHETSEPYAFTGQGRKASAHTVRSVQRMYLPPQKTAEWATLEYLEWLTVGLKGLIRVQRISDRDLHFRLFHQGPILLKLSLRTHRNEPSRHVLRVTGGILARETRRGRLEFKQALEPNILIAAVHEFEPKLPWWLYVVSQAQFHRYVMHRFNCHLQQYAKTNR